MASAPGVRDVKAMAGVLDREYDTLEDAARAVLETAWELYEKRARFVVVGHVHDPENPPTDVDDARVEWVCLGPFGTLKQAQGAGSSLGYSSQTGEVSRWAAIPYWTGTPAAWYKGRKANAKASEALADRTNPRELRHQMRVSYFESNPGATELPDHLQGNGWDGIDEFVEWVDEHSHECVHCLGTGRVRS